MNAPQDAPVTQARSSLKTRRRRTNPMQDYDRLPADLRRWLATAILPWRAQSVRRAYDKALARTGDPDLALRELDAMQARLIAKDARKVWGQTHPICHHGDTAAG